MKVNNSQMEILIDFLSVHKQLAKGRLKGREASQSSSRLWAEITNRLNNVTGGQKKEAKDWKKFYACFKSRVLKKRKTIVEDCRGTGGGSPKGDDLSPLEDRLLGILELHKNNTPAPGVRHNPLLEQGHESSVEVLVEQLDTSGDVPDFWMSGENEVVGDYIVVDVPPNDAHTLPEPPRSVLNENEATLSTEPLQSVPPNDERTLPEPPQRNERGNKKTNAGSQSAFEAAAEVLSELEQQRMKDMQSLAQVVTRHASAMEKHAAAMEDIAVQIRRFVDTYVEAKAAAQSRRPRRRQPRSQRFGLHRSELSSEEE